MRLPAAVGEILRWPGAAGALYASLRDLLGRGADSGSARPGAEEPSVAAIDARPSAALEKWLGLSTLIEILHAYIETAETLCKNLTEASEQDGWDDAAESPRTSPVPPAASASRR